MAKRRVEAEQRKRAFAAAFIGEANRDATRAAALAGYKAKGAGLSVQGNRMLNDPLVQQLLAEHAQRAGAKAEDVMRIHVEQMNGSFEDFVRIGAGGEFEIDMAMAKERGKMHLVRRMRQRRTTRTDPETEAEIVTVDTEVELYDAQKAARHVGEALQMYVKLREDVTRAGAKGSLPKMERFVEIFHLLGLDPVAAMRRTFVGMPAKQIEAIVLESKKPKETP